MKRNWLQKRVKQQTLSFPDAVQAIIEGYRVTKLEWNNSNLFGCLLNDRLMIHLEDGYHPWIVATGDLFAEDWVILD